MCQQLSDIQRSLALYAKCFDASLVPASDLSILIAAAAAIESTASAIKALAVARRAETQTWKDQGHRNAADALSKETGVTASQAREIIQTGQAMSDQPDLAQAALSGELSSTQTSLIAQATASNPDAVPKLIHQAKTGSLGELKSAVAESKAAASTDPESRYRAIHRRRRLRTWTDQEGAWHLHATGTPYDGALVSAAIDRIQQQVFAAHRSAGQHERSDAYAFDALLILATEAHRPAAQESERRDSPSTDGQGPPPPSEGDSTGPDPTHDQTPAGSRSMTRTRRGAPTKIIFRVDYDAWIRGMALPGETCEISGYGPVPISVVKDAVLHADPFIAAVITKHKTIRGVAHLGRSPTAHQQTALEWIYPTCAAVGCTVRARLERDHRIDWSKTHETTLEHLDLLCHHHHALKTRHNWALVAGTGKRLFVPPRDPRHPNHGSLCPTGQSP